MAKVRYVTVREYIVNHKRYANDDTIKVKGTILKELPKKSIDVLIPDIPKGYLHDVVERINYMEYMMSSGWRFEALNSNSAINVLSSNNTLNELLKVNN